MITSTSATLYLEGRLLAHRRGDGHPERISEIVASLLPEPFDRRLFVVRLALARFDITDTCLECLRLPPSHDAYVYNLHDGRLMDHRDRLIPMRRRDPRLLALAPYVDPQGFLKPPGIVRFGAVEVLQVSSILRTFGCWTCGRRHPSYSEWEAHACPGVPDFVYRVNSPDSFPNTYGGFFIPTDFRSSVRVHGGQE